MAKWAAVIWPNSPSGQNPGARPTPCHPQRAGSEPCQQSGRRVAVSACAVRPHPVCSPRGDNLGKVAPRLTPRLPESTRAPVFSRAATSSQSCRHSFRSSSGSLSSGALSRTEARSASSCQCAKRCRAARFAAGSLRSAALAYTANPDHAQLRSGQTWGRVQALGPTALAGVLDVEGMNAVCAARTAPGVSGLDRPCGTSLKPLPPIPGGTGGRGDLASARADAPLRLTPAAPRPPAAGRKAE